MKNIAKAIIAVTKEMEGGIGKGLTVGTGNNSYKGVADKDVKQHIGRAMAKNGLSILPIGIEATTSQDRWEETTQWGTKMKQSVFTEVKTKYLLLHESGESIELQGYGHGVDSQDKSAGKATTYALKYALLYTFLVPTGDIDDADHDHSDNKEVPTTKPKDDGKPWLNKGDALNKAMDYLRGGGNIAEIEKKYKLSTEIRKSLETVKNALKS